VPPATARSASWLLPLLDDLPELDFGPNMRAVLDEAVRYLERIEPSRSASAISSRMRRRAKLSKTVEDRVTPAGRVAVLVGGYPAKPQRRKLKEALGLAELRWVSCCTTKSLDDEMLSQCRRARPTCSSP